MHQGGRPMRRFRIALFAFAMIAGAIGSAWPQELLKVAIPQRGAWDAGVAELGQRGGIFKKHGLNLEILYVQAGPESIQAVIRGRIDMETAARGFAPLGAVAKGGPIPILSSPINGAPHLH